MRVDLTEFRDAYLAEVDEHLSGVNQRLVDLESARRDGRTPASELRELMRLLHTIKGLSAMVGVEPVVDIAHEMESVVRGADQAAAPPGEGALEGLIAGLRAMESRVAALAKREPIEPAPRALLARLASIVSPVTAAAPVIEPKSELFGRLSASEQSQLAAGATQGFRAVQIDFAPSPAKADAGISITTVRERIGRIGELVRVVPVATPASDRAPGGLVFALFVLTKENDEALAKLVGGATTDILELAGPVPALPPAEELHATFDVDTEDTRRTGFLRVEVTRVDDTIEKLSALIVTKSRLDRAAAALAARGADTRELDAVLGDTKRQLRDLRGALLGVRMVPLASVLDRLPLVVRGLGRSVGKTVKLAVEAGSTELDKVVAERLFPALVHCVRNAVDHGIEAPDVRRQRGKPEEGIIAITASAVGSRLVEIRISDDGAGIDPGRLAAEAKAGDVPRGGAAMLELMCRPGLSTRATVDRGSGRGVGMDIVKRTIESLGGQLALETVAGEGTTFIIRVPLTIAVVDAFTVSCAGRRFAVPVPAVVEIMELGEGTLPKSPDGNVHLLPRRGETVMLVELSSALGMTDVIAPTGVRHAMVVRRSDEETIAFAFDRVLGQQEAVVRPLTDPLVSVAGITGATDLGDGQPTLVLDLVALSSNLGGPA